MLESSIILPLWSIPLWVLPHVCHRMSSVLTLDSTADLYLKTNPTVDLQNFDGLIPWKADPSIKKLYLPRSSCVDDKLWSGWNWCPNQLHNCLSSVFYYNAHITRKKGPIQTRKVRKLGNYPNHNLLGKLNIVRKLIIMTIMEIKYET